MSKSNSTAPWVSFCISTYKRPSLLASQLVSLLKQTDPCFEIVISDNDPNTSAKNVVESLADKRIRYFQNKGNLGMIKSFNKSIERATTEYIVMVTDDDPVDKNFLAEIRQIINENPGYSVYGGFIRANKRVGEQEKIRKDDFLKEILDPGRTISLLWSSCILRRSSVIEIGKIPDFGSPHLADHALLVLTGSVRGGVVVNKMYSSMTQHETNFSKFNFEYYVKGCRGFYDTLAGFVAAAQDASKKRQIIIKHLGKWFISNIFNLKKYYYDHKESKMLDQVNECARQIISFPFMHEFKLRYFFKEFVFKIKKRLGY